MRYFLFYVVLLVVSVAVTACSLSFGGGGGKSPYGGTEHPTRVSVGKPYVINGKKYYPRYDPHYNEVGFASWYGPGFHGRMTASGERYDQNEITAAHRTLPMPSIVRVTRLDNGRSILVRVNDRGPFAKGRIIDLSKGAAKKLGIIKKGVAKVRVEYMPEYTERYLASIGLSKPKEWRVAHNNRKQRQRVRMSLPAPLSKAGTSSKTAGDKNRVSIRIGNVADGGNNLAGSVKLAATTTANAAKVSSSGAESKVSRPSSPMSARPATRYYIQTASFTNYNNALEHADNVRVLASTHIEEVNVGGNRLYRVMLGYVDNMSSAKRLLEKARHIGFADARIIID